jgi:hypothetical protein
MRNILTLLACLAFAGVTPGCSGSGEYCDIRCDCEHCSDIEYDECTIIYEGEEDKADAYGCGGEFAAGHDCVVVNNNCTSIGNLDVFSPETECGDELTDLDDCIRDNSRLR